MKADYKAKSYYIGNIAKKYIEKRANEAKWKKEQVIVKDIIDKYMKKDDIVLDVPFGTGRFANYYIDKGLKIYGVDISQDMLNEAKDSLKNNSDRVQLIIGDAEKLPFHDNSVDFIVCVRLMNWVSVKIVENFLREFSRVATSNLIIHIRVKDTSGAVNRCMKILRSNPLFFFKAVIKSLYKNFKSIVKCSNKNNTITIHEKEEINKLFNKYNLLIEEEIIVDESESNLRFILYPLYFYFLSVNNTY